jgi:hypothetical protein
VGYGEDMERDVEAGWGGGGLGHTSLGTAWDDEGVAAAAAPDDDACVGYGEDMERDVWVGGGGKGVSSHLGDSLHARLVNMFFVIVF